MFTFRGFIVACGERLVMMLERKFAELRITCCKKIIQRKLGLLRGFKLYRKP